MVETRSINSQQLGGCLLVAVSPIQGGTRKMNFQLLEQFTSGHPFLYRKLLYDCWQAPLLTFRSALRGVNFVLSGNEDAGSPVTTASGDSKAGTVLLAAAPCVRVIGLISRISPLHMSTALSIAFCSCLTLPGQSYASSCSYVCSEIYERC